MAITTRGELATTILQWMNRVGDTDVPTDDFINLTEAKLRRSKLRKHWRNEELKVSDVAERLVSLPTDWLEARYIEVQAAAGPVVMEYRSPHELSTVRKTLEATGVPKYYTISEGKLELCPDPSQTFTLEMLYSKDFALVGDAGTNWLLTNFPDVYLFNCLAYAAVWERDDAREAKYLGRAAQAEQEVWLDTNNAHVSGGPINTLPGTSLTGN